MLIDPSVTAPVKNFAKQKFHSSFLGKLSFTHRAEQRLTDNKYKFNSQVIWLGILLEALFGVHVDINLPTFYRKVESN